LVFSLFDIINSKFTKNETKRNIHNYWISILTNTRDFYIFLFKNFRFMYKM